MEVGGSLFREMDKKSTVQLVLLECIFIAKIWLFLTVGSNKSSNTDNIYALELYVRVETI